MAPVMTITTEPKLRIIEDRLQGTQIQALLAEHLADMRSLSPPESTHTLDLERLRAADIRFWSVWRGETLVGCGALKHLSDDHAEIKSMRTPRALRGQGAGRAMLVHLIEQARAGTLTQSQLQGGTFTLTNLGMHGIDTFTPIINLPQAAILGVGRIIQEPLVRDGQLTVGWTLSLSLTFDHRVVDGGPAARWLSRLSELIETADHWLDSPVVGP